MKDSSVFLGLNIYSYGKSKEKEINLGLDLQGGMSVTLVVSTPELVEQKCSRYYVQTPEFRKSFDAAVKKYRKGASGEDFLDIYKKVIKISVD